MKMYGRKWKKKLTDSDAALDNHDFDFVIDFSYVYSDHVHFQLGHKNKSNKGGPWYGENIVKWYFLIYSG